jgi:hypothetical protein
VGTVFEHTKLPLSVWFLAIYLMTQSKNAVSVLELKRQLGVGYKAAWLLKHRLLQTMLLPEEPRRLDGRVEIDDAYLGGERPGKPGRGSENTTAFVAGVQTSAEEQTPADAFEQGGRLHPRSPPAGGAQEVDATDACGLGWAVVL